MAKHGTLPEFLYQRHLEVSNKVHLNFSFHEDEDLNEDEACEEANNSDVVMKARTNSMKAVTKTLTSVPMQTRCLTRILPATVRPRDIKLLSTASQVMMSVHKAISEKLTKELKPVYLDVMNESYMHNVPKGSETHFKVVVVSSNFNDKPLIQRHRMVNEVLKEELATGVHALSIQAKTPEQWESSTNTVPKSPPCMGGSAR